MTLGELIVLITDAGAPPAVIKIVAEAVPEMSGTSPGQVRDIQKQYERARKQKQRKQSNKHKALAEANDAANAPENVRDNQSGKALQRPESSFLPSLLSSSDGNQGKKEKKETTARARGESRGTRIDPNFQLSEADKKFTIDLGFEPDETLPEFIDFWSGIPGVRGMKTNWPGTYRNRLRDLIKRYGAPNGQRAQHRNGNARGGGSSIFAEMAGYKNGNTHRPEPRPAAPAQPVLELTAKTVGEGPRRSDTGRTR